MYNDISLICLAYSNEDIQIKQISVKLCENFWLIKTHLGNQTVQSDVTYTT